jgi:AraC-like DNA-binding protein
VRLSYIRNGATSENKLLGGWTLFRGETPSAPLPLARYELLRSADPHRVREVVGRVLRPHRLDVANGGRLDARVNSVRLKDMAVSVIGFGCDVRVDFDPFETFFAVLIPLSGGTHVRTGTEWTRACRDVAVVVSPTDRVVLRWEADCVQLIVRVERAALEARLSRLLTVPLGKPLRFVPAMPLDAGHGENWLRGLDLLVSELDRPGTVLGQPLVARPFERTLMSALLAAHANNYTNVIRGHVQTAPSRAVSIALEWIEGHPKWQHTTASLAKEADVTERALQRGFRKHLNMRPMEYLREVRLRRVHDELLAAQSDAVTVTGVAAEWGFLHTGHFAAKYQQRFGEKPSDTLRR